ncbi:winged helix-turn-helix transcriptional regulator [Nocardia sp. CA-119907]|uniref:winged helix-turn-helix transcriptional regulator n=1 Tax=Nocardia sp. CA-119907 TaxID=3239973 RepID=UPI003D95FB76
MDDRTAFAPEAETCPIELAIRTIGGQWRMLVLRSLLMQGAQRYNSLLGTVAGISSKELTRNLRRLEDAGLVVRESRRQAASEVDVYTVTQLGSSLLPAFSSLGAFGVQLAQARSTGTATRR